MQKVEPLFVAKELLSSVAGSGCSRQVVAATAAALFQLVLKDGTGHLEKLEGSLEQFDIPSNARKRIPALRSKRLHEGVSHDRRSSLGESPIPDRTAKQPLMHCAALGGLESSFVGKACSGCGLWEPILVDTHQPVDPIFDSDPWKNCTLRSPSVRKKSYCDVDVWAHFVSGHEGVNVVEQRSQTIDTLETQAVREIKEQLERGKYVWIRNWYTRYWKLAKSPKEFMMSQPQVFKMTFKGNRYWAQVVDDSSVCAVGNVDNDSCVGLDSPRVSDWHNEAPPVTDSEHIRQIAAIKVQAFYRGRLARKLYDMRRIENMMNKFADDVKDLLKQSNKQLLEAFSSPSTST